MWAGFQSAPLLQILGKKYPVRLLTYLFVCVMPLTRSKALKNQNRLLQANLCASSHLARKTISRTWAFVKRLPRQAMDTSASAQPASCDQNHISTRPPHPPDRWPTCRAQRGQPQQQSMSSVFRRKRQSNWWAVPRSLRPVLIVCPSPLSQLGLTCDMRRPWGPRIIASQALGASRPGSKAWRQR